MWKKVNALGEPKRSKVAMEVIREDGSATNDPKVVINKWYEDISRLFSGVRDNPELAFDDNFYKEVCEAKRCFENLSMHEQADSTPLDITELNKDLSFQEVSVAVNKAKDGKAYMEIPNEALKRPLAMKLLHNFFNMCFQHGLSPTDWDFSNIIPIPKKDKDQRDPLNNRCITIMCCIAKIYSSVITARIQTFIEKNDLLADEQNGFRANRSCIDHIFSLVTILRNRKAQGKATFICFIDYKKAFDSVDRNLLLFKLSKIGIVGKVYNAIRSL